MSPTSHYLLTFFDTAGEQLLDYVVSLDWDAETVSDDESVRYYREPEHVAFWTSKLGGREVVGPLVGVRPVFDVVRPAA